ncbi:MAG: PD-(D/E)XK nuclease family transposase [Spirochaetales bacterium]|nr:PD-(D/E)XK nuclease family transposase [Spirochaetales bacterium]
MDKEKRSSLMSGDREEVIRRVMGFRLLDDEFMKAVFDGNKEATSLVLRIILGKPDLVVEDVRAQATVANFSGRSISVDILATDNGNAYNIEIQRADVGAIPKRARYHGSALDARMLEKGASFDELPETYVIFITERDFFGRGLPSYHFDRYCREIDRDLDDRLHIIYVNGQYRGDDEMGRLMRDFSCTSAADMSYNELAERMRYFKETEEGLESMSRTVEEYGDEREAKGLCTGRAEGADMMASLVSVLLQAGRTEDLKKASSDTSYREQLFKEFGIA